MADQTVHSKFTAVGGGEIQLGITRKPITAWGGMAVFAAFCETVGLRTTLDRVLVGLGRTSPNALPASDHMLAFMVGVLTGASRFLHLERLRVDAPLRERIEALTGLPTVVENDANSAAWAEHRFGAGQGFADLVLVIIGTGVGGGVVVGGSLVRGANGAAGEIGHVRVVPDGLPCGCGLSGCLEQYASGRALLRIARARIAGDTASGSVLLGMGDGTPEGIEGIHVSQAASQGDPLALGVFAEVGERLGQGLAELSAVLDPACFVLGGGVSESGDLLLNPTRDAYLRSLAVRGHRIPAEIRTATLGNSAGLVGAADLSRTRSSR